MATAILADTHTTTLHTITQWLQRAGVDVRNTYPLHTWYDFVRIEKPDLCFLNAAQAYSDKAFIQKARIVQGDTTLLLICPEQELASIFSLYGDYVFDIITYPVNLARIALTVRNALQSMAGRESKAVKDETDNWNEWLPGSSDSMNKLREKVQMVARSASHVLITGDNGTGKRSLAEHMHLYSSRAGHKVVSINCVQYPHATLQSLLFGTDGRLQEVAPDPGINDARRGTLILDNIDELPPPLQQRLHYALVHTHTDVRVISTATPALYISLNEKRFSNNLYNLLSSAIVHVPSLAERVEDIPVLVHRYAENWTRQWHTPLKMFTAAAMHALQQMSWPYNIRELKNTVERLILLGQNPVTETDVAELITSRSTGNENVLNDLFAKYTNLSAFKSYLEKEFILFALDKCQWNISHAADNLGIQRSQLYNKMEQYGIKRQPG